MKRALLVARLSGFAGLTAIIAPTLSISVAVAETKAEALFKKGKKLLAEKRYAAACEAFEESDKLDPAIGTKVNAARCFEEWGKLTVALRWYKDAEAMAVTAKDDREPQIKELIAALDAEIPRLIVRVPPKANLQGAGVKLDGAPLATFDKEILVDPGPHELQYQAGGETRTKTVQLERGGEREIMLEIPLIPEAIDDKTPPKERPKPKEPAPPGRTRRIIGISMAGGGVLGLGIAGYLTLDARSTYKDALTTHCGGVTNGCNDQGLQITKDARSQANTATIITIVGVALAAGGAVLYFTAPTADEVRPDEEDEALYLSPMIGDRSGGIVFGGSF